MQEAVIDQPDHAGVLRRSDNPAGGLGDFLQAGNQVGIGVAGTEALLEPLAQDFMPIVEGRQAERCHESADEAVAGQVDALTEHAPEYGQGDAGIVLMEGLEKRRALLCGHAGALGSKRQVGRLLQKSLLYPVEIGKAAEKRQVVAGPLLVLPVDQFRDGRQRAFPVRPPGADVRGEIHLKLVAGKGARQGAEAGVLRHAQQVPVIDTRRQGRGKHQRAVGGFEARGQEVRRDQVLDGESGLSPRRPDQLAQGMIAKHLRQFGEGQAFEQQFLQDKVRRMVRQVVGNGGDQSIQSAGQ